MNTIRIATTKDIPLIQQLAEQVFPETYKNIITPEQCRYMMDMMYSEESLRRQMTEEGHVYQLLSVDGEAAGYVSVQPIESDLYELQKIYVLPRFQGRHLGRTLFDAAVALVKKLHPEPCRIFLLLPPLVGNDGLRLAVPLSETLTTVCLLAAQGMRRHPAGKSLAE